MGGVIGDRGREVTGEANLIVHTSHGGEIGSDVGTGCFDAILKTGTRWAPKELSSGNKYIFDLGLESSRVTPIGAANVPRSWGSLACAYLGQRATA